MVRAGIIGVTGYAGGELARLLHIHPEVELASVASIDEVGKPLSQVFPNLHDIDLRVEGAPLEPYEKARAYFGLLAELRALLGTNGDLVSAGAIRNRYIAREVDRTKQMLYAA